MEYLALEDASLTLEYLSVDLAVGLIRVVSCNHRGLNF